MDRYHHFRDQLLGITRAISSLCDDVKSLSGIGNDADRSVEANLRRDRATGFSRCIAGRGRRPHQVRQEHLCQFHLPGRLSEAGRRRGDLHRYENPKGRHVLKATLFFKPWEEINREIENAMVLFPLPRNGAPKAAASISGTIKTAPILPGRWLP